MTTTYTVGAIVGVDDPKFPGRWEITGKGPKNFQLKPLGRPGRGLRAPEWMLTAPPEQTPAGQMTTVDIPEYFDTGTIVTCSIPTVPDGPLVVFPGRGDRINVTQLGGAGGRYWKVPARTLTRVPLADLPGMLTG